MRFIETCCGTAAVSLALIGGHGTVPPCALMGGKQSYAHSILAAMRLQLGSGCDSLVLCDPGPWGRVWSVLADQAGALAVQQEAEQWIGIDHKLVWEWARRKPGVKAIQSGVGTFTPEDVTRWLIVAAASYRQGDPSSGGFISPFGSGKRGDFIKRIAARCVVIAAIQWPSGVRVINKSAMDVEYGDMGGSIAYIDPPYCKLTGYRNKLSRVQVIELARRLARSGALIAISEAVPIPIPGFKWAIDITKSRVRQSPSGNFSAPRKEWLTLNFEPSNIGVTSIASLSRRR